MKYKNYDIFVFTTGIYLLVFVTFAGHWYSKNLKLDKIYNNHGVTLLSKQNVSEQKLHIAKIFLL